MTYDQYQYSEKMLSGCFFKQMSKSQKERFLKKFKSLDRSKLYIHKTHLTPHFFVRTDKPYQVIVILMVADQEDYDPIHKESVTFFVVRGQKIVRKITGDRIFQKTLDELIYLVTLRPKCPFCDEEMAIDPSRLNITFYCHNTKKHDRKGHAYLTLNDKKELVKLSPRRPTPKYQAQYQKRISVVR